MKNPLSLRPRRPLEKLRRHASISTLACVIFFLAVLSSVRVHVRGDAIHDTDATSGTTETEISATSTSSSVGECKDPSSSADNRDGTCRNASTDNDGIEIHRNGKTRDGSGFGPAKPSEAKVNVKWEQQEEATPSYYLNAFKIKEGDISKQQFENDFLPPNQCALYLAPSTLPNAGLGLFSGVSIPMSSDINEYIGGTFPGYDDDIHPPLWNDLHIPIADPYKTLPYRGQQKFSSWLGYVWPEYEGAFLHDGMHNNPFPSVPSEMFEFDGGLNSATGLEFYVNIDDETRMSSFAPGIASLANSHTVLNNMDRNYDSAVIGYEDLQAPWDAGAGAFTPHTGLEFTATKAIREGMELLLNYGEEWHHDHQTQEANRKKARNQLDGNSDESSFVRQREGFVEGIDKKWDALDFRERSQCPKELPTEKGKRDRITVGMAVDSSDLEDGNKPYSEYRRNDYHPSTIEYDKMRFEGFDKSKKQKKGQEPPVPHHPKQITKELSDLEDHGVCLSFGKLRVGRSFKEQAGRGVFSTTHIQKGETILTSPLLAIKRDDFTIYKSDPEQKFVRDVVDKSTIVGYELLLNYAFGHSDSPMLLVPSAPLANFINHGGPSVGEKPKSNSANVFVRWPEEGSKAAQLFGWAYTNGFGDKYQDFDPTTSYEHNPWLKMHPIDVMERSGKLVFEYVALRDIHNNEEILIDYGPLWENAWNSFSTVHPYARSGYFRHSIGVPPNLYPPNWLHVSDKYEIAEIKDFERNPLKPGEVLPLTWAHNGKPVSSKYAYVVGLPEGFSDRFLKYSEEIGVVDLYNKLLAEQEGYHLPSDGFAVYKPGHLVSNQTAIGQVERDMEFFAHRYHSDQFNFNMHFVAAWDEAARLSVLKALGNAGFDVALRGIGERFGYYNLTCFHGSYMGVTHCDQSKMHSDMYATDDKSWNIIFPLITVEGTDPELDIMAEDMNTIIAVHYLKDIAYAIGDFGYHQTRPIAYYDPEEHRDKKKKPSEFPIRVVFGAYCSQVDETNFAMLRHIYDGDDPAPFADQFSQLPMKEIHWDRSTHSVSLAMPGRA
eukprot:CAMPEP_0171329356 /NCGR_PEP_ID=MMETSP0878-20121228/1216_1 /TAXON_ID=67004 /ORGANISM="Thalassiosira weissflogii, Strain CCMP1336" /LENGTH=1054 /DNA_ID=CAMNT_0011829333 /DNA_START=95 /DNA_END=3259 /DNA_ORIENTATION=-